MAGLFRRIGIGEDCGIVSGFQQELFRHILGDQEFAKFVCQTFENMSGEIEKLKERIAKLEEVDNAKR